MNNFFATLGKIAIVLFVIGVLVGGGIYIGLKLRNQSGALGVLQNTATNSVTSEPANQLPNQTPSSTPVPNIISITSTSSSFASFKIAVPTGWTADSSQIAGAPKLTITNGNYQLIISQGAGGGAGCLYPGDPPQDFASSFNAFTAITGSDGEFRRATSTAGSPAGTSVYTVCDKKATGFGLPTQFGYITYNTPSTPDTTLLVVMDAIVASLKKQ